MAKMVEVPDELLERIVKKLLEGGMLKNAWCEGADPDEVFYGEDNSWVWLSIEIDKLRGLIEVAKVDPVTKKIVQ